MYEIIKYKILLLLEKLDEEIMRNKLCVDQIVPHTIHRKVKNKDLILKYVMIINPITGWFYITQYEDKYAITITNLV